MKTLRLYGAFCLAISLALAGCKEPENIESEAARQPVPGTPTIVSDGPVTVRNGQLTLGKPQVDQAAEKEIYKSLNHRRKMLDAIRRGGGSDRGAQQMRDEYDLIVRGFMNRYRLSRTEIDSILTKGDALHWD